MAFVSYENSNGNQLPREFCLLVGTTQVVVAMQLSEFATSCWYGAALAHKTDGVTADLLINR